MLPETVRRRWLTRSMCPKRARAVTGLNGPREPGVSPRNGGHLERRWNLCTQEGNRLRVIHSTSGRPMALDVDFRSFVQGGVLQTTEEPRRASTS
jgi:hypothetical protein